MSLFYESNIEKARQLSEEQKKNGWSVEDRQTYWYTLGYDIFFVNRVVEP